MDIGQGKVFFKPEAGMYLGTIIDIVEKPNVAIVYNGVTTYKNKVLITWVLTHPNNAPYLDPEGKPMTLSAYVTADISPKSTQPLFRNLYKIIAGVLGTQVPLITTSEQLEQVLLGRSNGIMVTKEPSTKVAGEFYVNPVGFMPLAPGQNPPQPAADFVRFKNRPKTQAGPNGQPVQTYAQPPAQQSVSFTQPAPAVANSPAPAVAGAPTPEQIAAYLAAQQAKTGNVPL